MSLSEKLAASVDFEKTIYRFPVIFASEKTYLQIPFFHELFGVSMYIISTVLGRGLLLIFSTFL